MLKQYLCSSIIVLFQFIGVVAIATIVFPLLASKTNTLSQLHQYLSHHKNMICFMHCLFYVALYFLWPHLIHLLIKHQQPSPQQINQAIQARIYLVIMFLIIEGLNLLL